MRLLVSDQNLVTDNPPEHQTPRHKINVLIDMPTPDAGISHEVTITLTPKRLNDGSRPSTCDAPLPRPPFPMTPDTSSDPTADVFGSSSVTNAVHSAAARKGTAANPHDESYPQGDAGLAESEAGLERRWYLVTKGREVGKLYRSW